MDGSYVRRHNSLLKVVLISFDGNAKNFLLNFLMFLQIVNTDIYNGYPTSLVQRYGATDEPCLSSGELSQHCKMKLAIAYFQFERLGPYW